MNNHTKQNLLKHNQKNYDSTPLFFGDPIFLMILVYTKNNINFKNHLFIIILNDQHLLSSYISFNKNLKIHETHRYHRQWNFWCNCGKAY